MSAIRSCSCHSDSNDGGQIDLMGNLMDRYGDDGGVF
jgi:hypothetical protein